MSDEKTHKPTSKKLEKARSEGKVLKSQLVTQTVVTIIGVLCIREIFKNDLIHNKIVLEYLLTSGYRSPELSGQIALGYLVKVVLTFLLLCAGFSILVEIAQVGLRLEPKVLLPQMKRLNPVGLLTKLQMSFGQLAQVVVRGFMVVVVFCWLFQDLFANMPALLFSSLEERIGFFSVSFSRFSVIAFIVLVLAAAVDYLIQRRRFNKEMMMSHTELKNEYKDQEGDPLYRSMRRSMHESLLMQDMITRVRKAKVVIVDRA